MNYFVYVIKSEEGFHYTGMTEDLMRIIEHNYKSCRFGRKEEQIGDNLFEEFDNKTEALKREKWFKTGVGREFLERILENK